MKRLFFLFLFLLALFAFAPAAPAAAQQTERAKLLQTLEILRHEISLLAALVENMQAAATQPLAIGAHSYIAVDIKTGAALLQRNAAERHPIASVTKLMSAVVATEHVDKNQSVVLTPAMLEPLGASPVLYLGLHTSAANLLKATLIQSSNDAAQALAHTLGQGQFVALMNQKAKDLGMANTVFYDAHGLNPANRSTAHDLAKLIAHIHTQHPEILSTTKENDFWMPDKTGRLLKFQNVNNFYPLGNFIGGKTGYLPQARQTLAAVFDISGKPTAIIVLNSANRQADTFRLLNQLTR